VAEPSDKARCLERDRDQTASKPDPQPPDRLSTRQIRCGERSTLVPSVTVSRTADNDGAEQRPETTIDAVRNEIGRLRDENTDLRASALLWFRLYEAAITRVNELERVARRDLANDR